MTTERDALKLAMEAAEVLEKLFKQAEAMHEGSISGVNVDCQITVADLRKGLYAAPAIREALAEQPAQQEPEPDRVKFERHWRKTRGDKKANRELPRHPLQPQTYIQDSANRHWVTWQAAVRSVSPQPAQQQEPVAWLSEGGDVSRSKLYMDEMGFKCEPLYKSPPQRKPLTDEEIWDEVKAADLDWQTGWSLDEDASNRYITFARAIEAAHGIKGDA